MHCNANDGQQAVVFFWPFGRPFRPCRPSPSENGERVFDERADLVEVGAYRIAGTVDGVAQPQGQVLGRAVLHGVADLVEQLALGAVPVRTGIDVVAAYVGELVAQARHAVAGEIQLVAGLPGALVLEVEIRVVGVGEVDAAATITVVIGIAGVAGASLVGKDEGVVANAVLRRQAPDGVAVVAPVAAEIQCRVGVVVVIGLVEVEVDVERLTLAQRRGEIEVGVVLLVHVLDIGVVQGGAEVVGEGVAATHHIDVLQAVGVTGGVAHGAVRGEAAGVQFEPLHLVAGDQGAGERLGQQAAVVMGEHGQRRELVAVANHRIGDAQLHRRASLGQVIDRAAVAVGIEEGAVVATPTAVELDAQQAEGIDTDTDGALGKAGLEGGDEALTPHLGIGGIVLEVAVEVRIAQQQLEAAVGNETIGLGLFTGIGQWNACGQGAGEREFPVHEHG